MLTRIVKKIFGNSHISYAQNGEDIILARIFSKKPIGFYVDVGAHHPKTFSNTCLLYKKGWSGINIDATPESMADFCKERQRDRNIEAAISESKEELTLYMFNKSPLNTLSRALADAYKKQGYPVVATRKIITESLKSILDKNADTNTHIDLLTVDAEDMDLEVLRSNDWNKYRPTVVLVEDLEFDLEQPRNSSIYNYLKDKGYKLISVVGPSLIFQTN